MVNRRGPGRPALGAKTDFREAAADSVRVGTQLPGRGVYGVWTASACAGRERPDHAGFPACATVRQTNVPERRLL